MKYALKVTEITHDELVSIFSMLCTSSDFAVNIKKADYAKVPQNKRNGNCFEDKCADILLNGGSVYVTDIQADEEVFSKLPHTIDAEDGSVTYKVSLEDFFNGFSNPDAMDNVKDLADENDDYWTAYNLIQYVVFGELIYG